MLIALNPEIEINVWLRTALLMLPERRRVLGSAD